MRRRLNDLIEIELAHRLLTEGERACEGLPFLVTLGFNRRQI